MFPASNAFGLECDGALEVCTGNRGGYRGGVIDREATDFDVQMVGRALGTREVLCDTIRAIYW